LETLETEMTDQLLGEILATLRSIKKEITLLRVHEDRKYQATVEQAERDRASIPHPPQF
jgi:hypothetical protein